MVPRRAIPSGSCPASERKTEGGVSCLRHDTNETEDLMLLLSRKCGEKVVIPGLNLTLAVLEIRDDLVRLGISAPADVPVHHQEAWQLPLPALALPSGAPAGQRGSGVAQP